MQFKDIDKIVDGIPYISKENAKFIFDFIVENKIQKILELGIAHGTATCYMAAALEEVGNGGKIDAVDLLSVIDHFKPSAEAQLKQAQLESYVEVHRMRTGYNWFLHDEIKRNTEKNICKEKYDLCIIDGPKNWTIDSSAFFLADKLLKQNGYIIFDDYQWTYGHANTHRNETDGIVHNNLSDDELTYPHIQEIYNLLVKQHPNYSEFKIFDDMQWVMAKKYQSEKKIEISNFNVNKNMHIAKEFGKLFEQISNLNKKDFKYLIYGFGSLGHMIPKLLDKSEVVGFVDINFKKICNPNVMNITDGLKLNWDYIVVTPLGRELEIKEILITQYNVPREKIISFED